MKALVFLVVIMGVTWIVGVLVMEVDALLPLAYIFAVMVAFQGVTIFLSLVAFQKPVRDEYIKWFKAHTQKSILSKCYVKSPGVSTLSTIPKVCEFKCVLKNLSSTYRNFLLLSGPHPTDILLGSAFFLVPDTHL